MNSITHRVIQNAARATGTIMHSVIFLNFSISIRLFSYGHTIMYMAHTHIVSHYHIFHKEASALNAEDQILRAVQILVDAALRQAPFDRTVRGRVVGQLSSRTYLVEINGARYAVPAYGTATYTENEIVWICIPENNFENRFILPKSASGATVTDLPSAANVLF